MLYQITDAAFRTPWFKLVKSFGWEFIGRARGKLKVKLLTQNGWKQIKSLFKHATQQPKLLGEGLMSTNHKFPIYFYAYQAKLYRRKVKRKKCRHLYPGKQEQYSKANREPWIIVSSLKLTARIYSMLLMTLNIYNQHINDYFVGIAQSIYSNQFAFKLGAKERATGVYTNNTGGWRAPDGNNV